MKSTPTRRKPHCGFTSLLPQRKKRKRYPVIPFISFPCNRLMDPQSYIDIIRGRLLSPLDIQVHLQSSHAMETPPQFPVHFPIVAFFSWSPMVEKSFLKSERTAATILCTYTANYWKIWNNSPINTVLCYGKRFIEFSKKTGMLTSLTLPHWAYITYFGWAYCHNTIQLILQL